MIAENIQKVFGNELRVRAMGVFIKDNSILLVKHSGLNDSNELWLPPGGGVEPGEQLVHALKREVFEEVGLSTGSVDFLLGYEFIKPPLHALEVFFLVKKYNGELIVGKDPELRKDQIIRDCRFVDFDELQTMNPDNYHPILRNVWNSEDLIQKQGSFLLSNNT